MFNSTLSPGLVALLADMTQVAAVGMISEELRKNLPGRLDKSLVLFTFQDLKIHDDDLE